MKKLINYPDWVEKYRTKGHTIKKLKAGYGLYSCTSIYVKGSNPKSVQTYLGMIDEYNGFVPKLTIPSIPVYLEFGLSHFIITNFKRELQRSTMANDLRVAKLSIVLFCFGTINAFFISSCALTYDHAQEYIDYFHKISNQRIKNGCTKINTLMNSTFPNDEERMIVLQGLRQCVIEKHNLLKKDYYIPNEIKEIIENAGCHYGS